MKQEILEGFLNAILTTFSIDREAFFTKSKRRDLADARYFLYYLCKHRPINMATIKRFMADNGYTIENGTILHGVNTLTSKIENDDDYFMALQRINNRIKF